MHEVKNSMLLGLCLLLSSQLVAMNSSYSKDSKTKKNYDVEDKKFVIEDCEILDFIALEKILDELIAITKKMGALCLDGAQIKAANYELQSQDKEAISAVLAAGRCRAHELLQKFEETRKNAPGKMQSVIKTSLRETRLMNLGSYDFATVGDVLKAIETLKDDMSGALEKIKAECLSQTEL